MGPVCYVSCPSLGYVHILEEKNLALHITFVYSDCSLNVNCAFGVE